MNVEFDPNDDFTNAIQTLIERLKILDLSDHLIPNIHRCLLNIFDLSVDYYFDTMSSLFEICPNCEERTSGNLFCSTQCRSSYLGNLQHTSSPFYRAATTTFKTTAIPNKEAPHPNPFQKQQFGEVREKKESSSVLKQYEESFDQDRNRKQLNREEPKRNDFWDTVPPVDE